MTREFAWAAFAVVLVVCTPIKASAREPHGFRLADGTLAPWGISKADFIKLTEGKIADDHVPYAIELPSDGPVKLPSPYTDATLFFDHDRFYEVRATGFGWDFGKVERSLLESLGKSYSRTWTPLNGITEDWFVGKVFIVLTQRPHPYGDDDFFKMEMYYEPIWQQTDEYKRLSKPATAPF
jgi:hypothetical protein